jgi:hypothetical protein
VFSYGSGLLRASGLNTTAINTLDAIQVSTTSEGILRVVYLGGVLFACGPSVIQPFQIDTNPSPTGFPFLPSSTTIQRGIASTNAIAGWEGHFTSKLMWAGSDNIVYALNGYEPVRISHHAIEHDLQNLSDKTGLRAFVFMNNGHPFWCLKCSEWTWVYDLLTSTWQERKSYGVTNWRGEQSAYMWGDWLIGDDSTGYLFRPDHDVYREDTSSLVWLVESNTSHGFPNRVSIPRADFFFAAGHGNITGDSATDGDPSVLISWSNDGGATFGNPLERNLGQGGRYQDRVTVNRTGQAGVYGSKWRLQVSDPVPVYLMGGTMDVQRDDS